MVRGSSAETAIEARTSIRFVKGTTTMRGGWAGIMEPTAEQIGQTCEPEGEVFRSAQKWNCAPRKMTTRSKPTKQRKAWFLFIPLIRQSLWEKGCGVKRS